MLLRVRVGAGEEGVKELRGGEEVREVVAAVRRVVSKVRCA